MVLKKENSIRIPHFNFKASHKHQRPGMEKSIVIIVALTALIFVAASAVMSQWSIEEMCKIVHRQFNEEQMVIAHNVKNFIEREFSLLKREIKILSRELEKNGDSVSAIESMLARVGEYGVSKIEFYDRDARALYTGYPFKKEVVCSLVGPDVSLPIDLEVQKINDLNMSKPKITPSGIFVILSLTVGQSDSRMIFCHVNLSWLLDPFLRDIKSGRTGYAWIIDKKGQFISHPVTSFIGQNAFLVRKERDHAISFVEINKIQRDEMLKGLEGTGRYFSGWHRELTGRIEKLIAYTPVNVSPSLDQNWSVAVVAPVSEIEKAVRDKYMDQFFMQIAVIFTIIAGASIIMFFEVKWSRHMEKEVDRQTDELVKSEAKYRSLVENAEDFIFTVDPNGRFLSMNSFTARFFKCRGQDHIGKTMSYLFPEEISKKFQQLIHTVFESKKSIRKESGFDLDSVTIFLDTNMVPLRSETGEVTAVLCIARDITENKKFERHLIHTEKLASVGTLAAGVAHEINNPLGVILGFCDLLLRKKDKTSQDYKDLKIIERQGFHCKEIVENLLGFVRTGEETGHSQTDLNLCLEDAITIARHRFEKEGILLTTKFCETIPYITGDSRKLQQVFLNLINNAADAMPQGGELTIRTFMDNDLHMALVQFQDEGVAIADKDIDRVFEPFFTTKPEGKGTGLGLFVSYGIITSFGGKLECEIRKPSSVDAVSGGTVFTVKLMAIS